MKTCPSCGESIAKRKKLEDVMVCPICEVPLALIDGELVKDSFIPPIQELTISVERALKKVQDNLFYYRIPNHMQLRTKQTLERAWKNYFPIMESKGITKEEAVVIFEQALDELIGGLTAELGLVLWYISGKDTNKFQVILTKYVRTKERLINLDGSKVDEWLD